MKGRLCSVVPTDVADHCEALFEAFSLDTDERNWTYLPYGPFGSAKVFEEWMNTNCTGDDPLFHTILDGDEVPVGLASFLRIDPYNGSIEVGHIHYSPRIQRKAEATEAMFLMMSRVFDELGYRRYEWKCDALNAPSCKAAERLGFIYEGTFRQATHYKGRNRDTAWFSIIDKEWPRVREAFTLWLELANFDESGKQKSPLKAKSK
jgi:RimJ/RimL family protein N-acetyltransferase